MSLLVYSELKRRDPSVWIESWFCVRRQLPLLEEEAFVSCWLVASNHFVAKKDRSFVRALYVIRNKKTIGLIFILLLILQH